MKKKRIKPTLFFSLFLLLWSNFFSLSRILSFSIVHCVCIYVHHLWLKKDRWISTYLLLDFAHVMPMKWREKKMKKKKLDSFCFSSNMNRQVSISMMMMMIASETRRLSCYKSSSDYETSRVLLLNNDSSIQSIYIINIDFQNRIR